MVIEEEEDTRGERTNKNIKTYNIKSAIYNFESAWKDVKMITLSNLWKKIMLNKDPDIDLHGLNGMVFINLYCVL